MRQIYTKLHKMTDWKPKPKQKKLLEAAQTPGLNRTIFAMCKEAGIVTKTFYNWYEKDEDFKKAWLSVWEWQIDKYMPSVVAAQVKEAQGGSTQAARYLSDVSGKMVKRVDLTGKIEILKGYVNVSPDNWDEDDTTDNG